MGERSAIEWTDATWTPVRARYDGAERPLHRVSPGPPPLQPQGRIGWHCEHVSEGCRNCYAEAINRRLGTGLDFKPGNRKLTDIFLDEDMLLRPLRWRRPRRIFVCSMTDLFADFVADEWIDRMFAVMALAPQHVFQVLTKRPERMRDYFANPLTEDRIADRAFDWASTNWGRDAAEEWNGSRRWPLPNVWLGTSVEDQASANARIPMLLRTPAAARFLSCEPLLGRVDLTNIEFLNERGGTEDWDALALHADETEYLHWSCAATIHWVIAGGESGPKARPIYPDWVRSLRDQCAAAGVPFFFKQWGSWGETYSDGRDGPTHFVTPDGRLLPIESGMEWPIGGVPMRRMGKSKAARWLDSATHDGMPA